MMKTIKINGDYIELGKLLKMVNVISSGGEAKYYLQDNEVLVNGELENRRGKKLYPGDVVKVEDEEYTIK
ncbi:MAG: S4 domain-containing protein YaaA [Acholeplasmatales bacterium]|nr:S4 domain-containing protein YaaA [Acholeplasmatales bacterium]